MNTEEFLKSPETRLFVDEDMRRSACEAAGKFLDDYKPVKAAQVRTILSILAGGGFKELKNLVENQKKKYKGGDKTPNDCFWGYVHGILIAEPGSPQSFRELLKTELERRGMLQELDFIEDKILKKQAGKSNRLILEYVMDQLLPIYFEHFSAHYFYRAAMAKRDQEATNSGQGGRK